MPPLGDFLHHPVQVDACRKRKDKRKRQATKAGQKAHDRRVSIYFATESGTAHRFANELAADIVRNGYSADVTNLKDFQPKTFQSHRCVILLVSTYGNGEPPSSSQAFSHWLDDTKRSRDTLKCINFSVFGFGSRDYVDFNAFARHCDAGMAFFGAGRMCQRGEADSSSGDISGTFKQWKSEQLLPSLESTLGVRGGGVSSDSPETRDMDLPSLAGPFQRSMFAAARDEEKAFKKLGSLPMNAAGTSAQANCEHLRWLDGAAEVTVLKVGELRQTPKVANGESTKHIELLIDPSVMKWETAGSLEVMPKNSADDVNWFSIRLDAAEVLDQYLAFPRDLQEKRLTLRDALTLHLDLSGQLQLELVQALASLTQDPSQRSSLQLLANDASAFQWLATDARLNLREFIALFLPGATIDLDSFMSICPRQKPRPYTIASSCLENSRCAALCVSMVQETLPSADDVVKGLEQRGIKAAGICTFLETSQRCFRGLCSSYLCNGIGHGDSLWIRARPSGYSLPTALSTPMIMIAAGSGVAPFRAFLREIRAGGCTRQNTALFFGCRGEHIDYLYREEMEEASRGISRALGALALAFSRDRTGKQYVQDQLLASAAQIRSMFKSGSVIYVCGNRRMGRAVRLAISHILQLDDIMLLVQDGLYMEELW